MDTNTELLNYLYQNSQMGVETLGQLLHIAKDEEFCKVLQSQWNEYKSINDEAKNFLHVAGHEEKSIGNMAKISAYMSINIKTLTNNSASHIAEMLISGSTMGIIEATKNLKEYDKADARFLDLAKRLLKTEQQNIEQLKLFL